MALARLGRTDARLALSAADCAELEQLAAEWFERGVGAEYLTGVLTAGLPDSVGSPFGFVRRTSPDKPWGPSDTPPHGWAGPTGDQDRADGGGGGFIDPGELDNYRR
ncbi:hypothetical protein EAO76_15365 [Streptomyces sp. sk2.1]|nr:hypothetical protein EAO76_15365 [Streptomyces sp. sk2.1]